jgi:hypothetical protein
MPQARASGLLYVMGENGLILAGSKPAFTEMENKNPIFLGKK